MKIKIVAIITVVLLFVAMYVPVYADTVIPYPPGDVWEYWVVVKRAGGTVALVASHNAITVEEGTYLPELVLNTYQIYLYEENQWEFGHQGNKQTYFQFATMHHSNHDIAYEDGSGFFFLRPKASQLSQAMIAQDFGTILRNFSAGLIPILGCLILVLSLAKAWEFLRTQLKH